MAQSVGLYLHIPFCRHLCHYCDFAKTANFSASLEQQYWQWLVGSISQWLAAQNHWFPDGLQFKSVFLGGGTPSLYAKEWQQVFEKIAPYILDDAEVTIEANPDDMTAEKLQIWRDLGINRLSIGIQSFQESGLRFLTRWHRPQEACHAIEQAAKYMKNINIDLIYAWPGQSEKDWLADLSQAVQSSVCHLSLYNLSYESGTPIGRRVIRGVLDPMEEAKQAGFYQVACDFLATHGFEHQEVSNWAKPGFSCQHNWIYWNDQPYLAFGLGASGYLHHKDWPWGLRYQYPKRLPSLLHKQNETDQTDLPSFLQSLGASCEISRDGESWMLETIGCGLRSRLGIDVKHIEERLSRQFEPRPLIQEAMHRGWLRWNNHGRLTLSPKEWFRETSWSLELALSFEPQIVT
ncbi:MAG: radical SAM family heme chaperone HemW [Oligoflexus sp.]